MVKNWKYYLKAGDIGLLKITNGQYMTGNIIGILIEEKGFIDPEENLVNAKTFSFPVRYKTVRRYTGSNYDDVVNDIRKGLKELELEGCRAIVTSGGQLGLFRNLMHEGTDLLLLSSPLELIHFVRASISRSQYICIVNELSVRENIAIMQALDINEDIMNQCIFTDLEMTLYRDVGNKLVQTDSMIIGSYIWDTIERQKDSVRETKCPIYSIVSVTRFIKNAVMQIPYEGGI